MSSKVHALIVDDETPGRTNLRLALAEDMLTNNLSKSA
jgi:hypothetical protein